MKSSRFESRSRRVAAALSATGLLAASLTACGGANASSAAGGTAGGDVVRIGVVQEATGAYASDYLTEWGVGAQAAVDYLNNEQNGFGGRTVELVVCDSQSSAAGALTCANRFVAEKVDFVTGLSVYWGANGIAVLQKAGIPSQTGPISVQDASSPISFPYGGGIYSELGAATNYATTTLGAKKVAAVVADGAGNDIFFQLYKAPVDAAGGEFVPVLVPPTGDLAPSISKAVEADPDVIVTPIPNQQLVPYYEGLAQQGFDMTRTISVGAAVDADNFFDKVTDRASIEGTRYTYEFASFDDTSDPEVKTYRDAMSKYSTVPGRGEFYQWAFATVMTNYGVAKTMGFEKFDAASLVEALNTQTVPIFMGYEYSKSKYATPDAPGIGNPWIRFVQYEGGQVKNLSTGWLNGFTGETVESTG